MRAGRPPHFGGHGQPLRPQAGPALRLGDGLRQEPGDPAGQGHQTQMDPERQGQRPGRVLREDPREQRAAAQTAHVRRGGGEPRTRPLPGRRQFDHGRRRRAAQQTGGAAGQQPSREEQRQTAFQQETPGTRRRKPQGAQEHGSSAGLVGVVPRHQQHRDDGDGVDGEDDRHHELGEPELFLVEPVQRGGEGGPGHSDGEYQGGGHVARPPCAVGVPCAFAITHAHHLVAGAPARPRPGGVSPRARASRRARCMPACRRCRRAASG